MITYQYKCESCNNIFEFQQSIKDKSRRKKCPHCLKYKLERLICAPTILTKEIKTLGQLAEKNTKEAGFYGLQEKRRRQKESSEKGQEVKRQAIAEKMGGKVPERIKNFEPWYGKPTKDVNKMNKKQQRDYIMGED